MLVRTYACGRGCLCVDVEWMARALVMGLIGRRLSGGGFFWVENFWGGES